ncbi:MAG TPA: hypothetical protein VNQ48_00850 [Microbacteriaceae bacterium]|nr:hypothetical protein [Microbacteriaceae bacterium]
MTAVGLAVERVVDFAAAGFAAVDLGEAAFVPAGFAGFAELAALAAAGSSGVDVARTPDADLVVLVDVDLAGVAFVVRAAVPRAAAAPDRTGRFAAGCFAGGGSPAVVPGVSGRAGSAAGGVASPSAETSLIPHTLSGGLDTELPQ